MWYQPVLFGIDALHEIRQVVDGPVCILCLELKGELPSGVVGIDALSLEIKGPCLQIGYERLFLPYQGTVSYGAVIR